MYPDSKELDDIGDHEDIEMETDPEILARHEGVDVGRGFGSHGYQDQVRHIMVYEAYIMLDVEGEGVAKLHRVVKAGNAILDIEQVDRRPFVTFCPLPIPHSFYGSNFAEKLCATQNARTVLTRSILDHAYDHQQPKVHGRQRWSHKSKRAYRQQSRGSRECVETGCNQSDASGTTEPIRFPDPETT